MEKRVRGVRGLPRLGPGEGEEDDAITEKRGWKSHWIQWRHNQVGVSRHVPLGEAGSEVAPAY